MGDAELNQFRSGELVAERYRITRFIARGGMGEVYEAEDLELRQTVALKTVHPREARHDLAVERFKREIHLARRVTHPNVCRIYDVGYHTWLDGESVIFLSMELLDGETLAQLLKRRGPLEPSEALPLVTQMMEALTAAHAAGVVHRDFKSENVFLVPSGGEIRVVVTDFGVARGVEYDEFAARVTVADAAVGTPAYMAPEQVEGAAITPSIDQYALGVVMFELVTGRLPFAGDTPLATAVKRLTQAAPSPEEAVPGLDPVWVQVIRRCLARRPEDRFSSIRDARQALAGAPGTPENLTVGTTTHVPAVSAASKPAAPPRRRRQIWLLAGLSIALLLALVQAVVRIRTSLESPLGEAGEVRRAVAVVPFRNLAQREEFDWLSVALAEMVASELRAGEGLRTVSGDAVARAGVDLALGASDELSAEKLSRLKSRLGADYVVAGSFTILGKAPAASVRLAVRVEDTWKRETIGEAVESGGEQQLFDLVTRVGVRLRQLLGGVERRAGSKGSEVTPRNPRAARLYSEGLLKLRTFEPQTALDLLERAKTAEPTNPMIRAALASSWSALGFELRAEKEAEEALALGRELPPEERFVVEALAAELRRDWQRATEIYGKLWAAFPDNLEYGLKLGRAQLEGGRSDLALATFASLRELPEPDRDNPQIDLAEAAAALAASDFHRQQEAAVRAALKAREMEAPLLVAEARVREAEALRRLGKPAEAEAAAAEARSLYAAAGDRVGEASALAVAAGALFDRGELVLARAANQEALRSYREAGDRDGVARTLNGLAVLARNLGELATARELYSEALAVLAEIDDRRGTAYARNNLAAVRAEEGRFSAARNEVDAALAVMRELGDKSGTADALLNLGAIERQLGNLDRASVHLEEALRLKRELGLKSGEAAVLMALGGVALDRGVLVEAARHFEEAARLAAETNSRAVAANVLAAQGELAIEAGETEVARQRLAAALAIRTELGRRGKIEESRAARVRLALESGEPRAALEEVESLLAETPPHRAPEFSTQLALAQGRALAGLGRASEARVAVERAQAAAAASESPQLALQTAAVAIQLALAGAAPPIPEESALDSLIADARGRGLEVAALELEILRARRGLRRDPRAARSNLADLAADCERRGLLRLARQARAAED